MPIYSGKTTGLKPVTDSDTTLLQVPVAESYEVYSGTLHNRSESTVVVELFLSDDASSDAAERVLYVSLDAGRSEPIRPIGMPASRYLIGKASASGVNFYATYTRRTGSEV